MNSIELFSQPLLANTSHHTKEVTYTDHHERSK